MEMSRAGVPVKCPNCNTEFVVIPAIQSLSVAGERVTSSDVSLRVEFADFVIRSHHCAGVQ